MADIADRVGCSRATVYNHFRDRDVLLEVLCTQYLEGYLDIHAQVSDWAGDRHTVFDVLRETIGRELRWRVSNGDLRDALDTAKGLRKTFYLRGDAKIDDAMLDWFGRIYDASERLGLLRQGLDVPIAARAVYAMIDRTTDQVAGLVWHAMYRIAPEDAPFFSELGVAAPDANSLP
jgi:AcrR family transcriptional regulator